MLGRVNNCWASFLRRKTQSSTSPKPTLKIVLDSLSFCANFISMKKTNEPAAQITLSRLGHVTPTIQAVLDKAITASRGFFENRKLEIDRSLFPDLVRYEAKLLRGRVKCCGKRFSASLLCVSFYLTLPRHFDWSSGLAS